MLRKKSVNTKQLCSVWWQNAEIGSIKKNCWCSEVDFTLYYLSTLLSLSKERNNEDTMERAKKVVLISMENLERMQHQLSMQRQNPTSFADEKSKEITVPQNSDNIMNTNNITQTFGTHLTFDAEKSRTLNSDWPRDESERWKMYREVLWRYLRFIQEMQKTTLHEMFPMTTNGGVFHNFKHIANFRCTASTFHQPILLQKILKFRANIIMRRIIM